MGRNTVWFPASKPTTPTPVSQGCSTAFISWFPGDTVVQSCTPQQSSSSLLLRELPLEDKEDGDERGRSKTEKKIPATSNICFAYNTGTLMWARSWDLRKSPAQDLKQVCVKPWPTEPSDSVSMQQRSPLLPSSCPRASHLF